MGSSCSFRGISPEIDPARRAPQTFQIWKIMPAIRSIFDLGFLGLGRSFWGTFLVRFQVELFLLSSCCPVKRGNRAGSSRNESNYSRRGTQISFPLFQVRSCENFGLAHFSTFMLEKKVEETEPPFWSIVSLLTTKLKNELDRNSLNSDSREAKNWSGYLSESSQTHSEKSRPDFLSIRGNN